MIFDLRGIVRARGSRSCHHERQRQRPPEGAVIFDLWSLPTLSSSAHCVSTGRPSETALHFCLSGKKIRLQTTIKVKLQKTKHTMIEDGRDIVGVVSLGSRTHGRMTEAEAWGATVSKEEGLEIRDQRSSHEKSKITH